MTDFLKRMNDRLTARGMTGRQDLELHDAKSVEQGRAVRVLATYSPVYGPPSVHDVQHWLRQRMGEFADKIQARGETLAAYPEKSFVTFIIESKVLRQPLTASADMVPAGVDQYLDAEQNLWEVVKAGQGPSYIVKRESTPVEKMLEFRRQALRGGASSRKHVTLAAYDTMPAAGGGFAAADVGDTVDFYANGAINRGKVTSVTANGVKVSTASDSFTIDPAAITAIVEKGAGGQKEQDDVVRRYFSLVYPGNPKMTEIISPLSNKPLKDPRPLEVEPIEKAMSASVSATVKVAKPMAASRLFATVRTNLEGVNFEGRNFEGADFEGANLRNANLRNANLRNANLRNANLRNANLTMADLRGADLRGADLRGADTSGADMTDARKDDATIGASSRPTVRTPR